MKTNWRTIWIVVAATFILGGLITRWELKIEGLEKTSDVHTIQLDAVGEKIATIQLVQHDQTNLLKYIANGRKGSVPVTTSTGGGTGEPPSN